jgi:hypothetical protein
MEMQGQLWLTEATSGTFTNGKCKQKNAANLPEALKTLDSCRPDEQGEIKLSLEQLFFALAALGHDRAKAIVADIKLERASRWRAATEKRNTSILAHGVQPIGSGGFEQMKALASELLGFDLTTESNPVPSFDSLWLE